MNPATHSATSTARKLAACSLALIAGAAQAQTTQVSPDRFRIESGVAIEIRHIGNSSYFFDWTDSSGSFTTSGDPTFELAAGETYTFQRASTSHPFAICDDTLPVTGSDGNHQRTTFSSAVIDTATLTPIADFTADPPPATDQITWTPTSADVGTYYYTCTITGHAGMTGRIDIIDAEPCPADVNGDGSVTDSDFFAWVTAFTTVPETPESVEACDVNLDGSCTDSDFFAWVTFFTGGGC